MDMPDNWDKVIIRDLTLEMFAGIYEHEKAKSQRVVINIALDVHTNLNRTLEEIDQVVSYEDIIKKVEILAKERHYDLLESFAENIAMMCLKYDNKIKAADVRIEKPDIIDNTVAVGVHILRSR